MTTINEANAVYYRVGQLGGGVASAVYAGSVKVWPPPVVVERIQARPPTGGTAATSGNYTHGAGFTATKNGRVTHIATYHYADLHTAGQLHPLSLWTNAGVKVAHVDFVCPGSGLFDVFGDRENVVAPVVEGEPAPRATAWYEVALATPYAIVAGSTYRVSCSAPTYTYFSTAAPASLAPHLTVYQSGFYIAGSDVFPTTAQPANYYPIDVVAEM